MSTASDRWAQREPSCDSAVHTNAWLDRLLATTPAPATVWDTAALVPDTDLLVRPMQGPNTVAHLQQRLDRMAEVLDEIATPVARTAARHLRGLDVPTLLTQPTAQTLLYELLDGFRHVVAALAADPAATGSR